jgi:hypothetical protein
MVLTGIGFYPSMVYFDTLETIPYELIPDASVTIEPGRAWGYTVYTPDDMVGGHIYGHFTVWKPGQIERELEAWFDHPVIEPQGVWDVPSITGWGLLVLAVLLVMSAVYVIKQRRRPMATR